MIFPVIIFSEPFKELKNRYDGVEPHRVLPMDL